MGGGEARGGATEDDGRDRMVDPGPAQLAPVMFGGCCSLALPGSCASRCWFVGPPCRLQIASDVDYLLRFSRTVRELAALERDGFNTARLFLRTAARFPTKPALVCDDQAVTFQELDAASNRVANWAAAQVRANRPQSRRRA